MLDSEFADVWRRGLNDHSQLTETEALQFEYYFGQTINHWVSVRRARDQGMIPELTFSGWNAYYSAWVRQDALRRLWETTLRFNYAGDPGLQSYVDSVLEDEQ